MTIDELIHLLREEREKHGGDLPVTMMHVESGVEYRPDRVYVDPHVDADALAVEILEVEE